MTIGDAFTVNASGLVDLVDTVLSPDKVVDPNRLVNVRPRLIVTRTFARHEVALLPALNATNTEAEGQELPVSEDTECSNPHRGKD